MYYENCSAFGKVPPYTAQFFCTTLYDIFTELLAITILVEFAWFMLGSCCS